MNDININGCNLNFGAKLNIANAKGSPKRWNNIAKLFEKETAYYPNDICNIYESFSSGIIFDMLDKNKLVYRECCVRKNTSKNLAKLSDIEIVKKLKSLFTAYKEEEKIGKIANETYKKLEVTSIKNSEDADNAFWSAIDEIQDAKKFEIIEKHWDCKKDFIYV